MHPKSTFSIGFLIRSIHQSNLLLAGIDVRDTRSACSVGSYNLEFVSILTEYLDSIPFAQSNYWAININTSFL